MLYTFIEKNKPIELFEKDGVVSFKKQVCMFE